MNPVANKTIYIRNEDVWNDAMNKARVMGLSMSSVIESLLGQFAYDQTEVNATLVLDEVRRILAEVK